MSVQGNRRGRYVALLLGLGLGSPAALTSAETYVGTTQPISGLSIAAYYTDRPPLFISEVTGLGTSTLDEGIDRYAFVQLRLGGENLADIQIDSIEGYDYPRAAISIDRVDYDFEGINQSLDQPRIFMTLASARLEGTLREQGAPDVGFAFDAFCALDCLVSDVERTDDEVWLAGEPPDRLEISGEIEGATNARYFIRFSTP